MQHINFLYSRINQDVGNKGDEQKKIKGREVVLIQRENEANKFYE